MKQVDKNIKPRSDVKYPFFKMEVGDSFDGGPYSHELMKRISSASYMYTQTRSGAGKKFSTKKHEQNGQLRVRCWRIH